MWRSIAIVLFLVVLVDGRSVWALTLTSPSQGATLQAGRLVTVEVSVGKEFNLRSTKSK